MKRTVALFLVTFFTAVSGFAQTVELMTTEYEPFCGTKGNTMWCELINTAFAREGVDVKWTSYPQDREKLLVSEGTKVAFLSGTLVVAQSERSNFIMNENPLIYLNVVAFFPKDKYSSGLGIKSSADLKGKTVGAIQGTGSISVLQKAQATLDPSPDKDLLIKKLIAGRYDIAVVGDLTGLDTLQELAADKAGAYKYESVYNSPIDLIFSAKSPDTMALKKKYDSGIAKIKADGTFMKILAKYYPKGDINKNILPKDMQ
jgi:polar amino acid transport system substrate-binding protein